MNVLPTLLMSSLLFAQVPVPGQGDDKDPQPKVTFEQRQEGLFELTHFPDGRVEERMIPKPEAEMMRRDFKEFEMVRAEHLFHCAAFAKPRRIAPGQTGELWVVVTLTKPHVVVPKAHNKLALTEGEFLSYGAPELAPPKEGEYEKAFKGQLVYDDTLVYKMTISVSPKAKIPSEHPVKGRIELALHDGKSGNPLGKYYGDVHGLIKVGKPLPTPSVRRPLKGSANAGANEGPDDGPGEAEETTGPETTAPASAGPGDTSAGRIEGPSAAAGAGSEGATPTSDPLVAETSGIPPLSLVFGGVILVLLALILLARRN